MGDARAWFFSDENMINMLYGAVGPAEAVTLALINKVFNKVSRRWPAPVVKLRANMNMKEYALAGTWVRHGFYMLDRIVDGMPITIKCHYWCGRLHGGYREYRPRCTIVAYFHYGRSVTPFSVSIVRRRPIHIDPPSTYTCDCCNNQMTKMMATGALGTCYSCFAFLRRSYSTTVANS